MKRTRPDRSTATAGRAARCRAAASRAPRAPPTPTARRGRTGRRSAPGGRSPAPSPPSMGRYLPSPSLAVCSSRRRWRGSTRATITRSRHASPVPARRSSPHRRPGAASRQRTAPLTSASGAAHRRARRTSATTRATRRRAARQAPTRGASAPGPVHPLVHGARPAARLRGAGGREPPGRHGGAHWAGAGYSPPSFSSQFSGDSVSSTS
jgi:hypothetical protein